MNSLKPVLGLTLLVCALIPCGLATAADSPADEGAIATKLKQMENTWGESLLHKDHGVSVVSDLLADDFAGVNSKGHMQTKPGYLEEMKTEDTLTESTTDSMEVHVYGGHFATVCGTSTEKGTGKDGKAFSHHYGWVDTWMERNGKWQCIAEAGMLIGENK